MKTTAPVAVAMVAAFSHGAQLAPGGTTIDRDDIAGVVAEPNRPEAGICVPDLPQAVYDPDPLASQEPLVAPPTTR